MPAPCVLVAQFHCRSLSAGLSRLADNCTPPQCGLPLRGCAPTADCFANLRLPRKGESERESHWIGGVGGRLTQCPPTDTLFQVSVPKSWAKILGCKVENFLAPAKPFKEREKIKKPPEQAYLKDFQVFYAAERGKKERLKKTCKIINFNK